MSEAISNFHFIRPAGLLLIPLALLVWWLWQRRSDPLAGWRTQIDPELLGALAVGKSSLRKNSRIWILLTWLLIAIAISGPTWRPAPSPFAEDTTPLFLLLKASESMDNKDIQPSRLERAQLEIADLVSSLQGQSLGLIAYAGSAHLVIPPTRDAEVVSQMASEISSAIMPTPGDRLDLALQEAERVIKGSGTNGSVLIVADSIDTDSKLLAEAAKSSHLSFQILSLSLPDSSDLASIKAAARSLDATVQTLQLDDSDSSAIARRAAGVPVYRSANTEDDWEDTGIYLVPLIAFLFLLTFRQEVQGEEVAS